MGEKRLAVEEYPWNCIKCDGLNLEGSFLCLRTSGPKTFFRPERPDDVGNDVVRPFFCFTQYANATTRQSEWAFKALSILGDQGS